MPEEKKDVSVTSPEGLEATLNAIKPDVNKAFDRAEKNEKIERNVRKASLELIRRRRQREYPFDVLVNTERDENGDIISKDYAAFIARRPTDKDRVEFLSLTNTELALLPDDQLAKVNQQFYEFLSKVMIEPDWTPDEWSEVDQALQKELLLRLIYLANNADDGKVFDFFIKLSS